MSPLERIRRELLRLRNRFRPAAPVRLEVTDRPGTKYGDFAASGVITIPRTPLFEKTDVFFTMGSCFAEEIRIALTSRRIACVPSYRNIRFDPAEAIVDTLPGREHMNFYNTFTVRLQIEQLLGLWEQGADDWWKIRKRPAAPWGPVCFQDPYRRLILAKSPEILARTIGEVNAEMRRGFDAATAFIFTFGMTEVFVNRATGKVASQKPLYGGGGGSDETTLHVSTFQENLDNVLAIVDMIQERKPGVPIVLTVSPVALSRTFQDADVVTINSESKSILRAVLGQVCRERQNVHYLPSFEFVTYGGLDRSYKADRRHVKRPVVDQIVEHFFQAYFSGPVPDAVPAPKTPVDAEREAAE